MPSNFLKLIAFLVDEFSAEGPGGMETKLAFQLFGENNGAIPLDRQAGARQTIEMMMKLGLFDSGAALSCGLTANALCLVFLGTTQPANLCGSLAALRLAVADGQRRLIRIDQSSHSFVIEQLESPAIIGNLYQSNIAVLGNSEFGIRMQKYLREHDNPLDINGFLDDLDTLASASAPPSQLLDLYNKRFTVPSYRANPDTKPITESVVAGNLAKLNINRLSWQAFADQAILDGIEMIMKAAWNLDGATKARKLWADCRH